MNLLADEGVDRQGETITTQFAVSLDSVRIAYDVTGSGPALMLLHGGGAQGANRRDWHDAGYVARLRDAFMVIAVDLRGHGESDQPVDPACYTTEKMGQDLLTVADACNIRHFALWGFSFGANLARYLAARSDRVDRAILVGCRFGAGARAEFRRTILDFCARWTPAVEAQAVRVPGAPFNPQLLSPAEQAELQELGYPAQYLPVVMAFSRAMVDWPLLAPAELRCPALWLMGTENAVAQESLREYASTLPASRVQVQVLSGLTHGQEFDAVDRVLPVALAFLESSRESLSSGEGLHAPGL